MYGPFEAAGGACSGYLVTAGGTRVLIDCGNGVLGRLQQHCSYNDLAAVILSHLHPDHISDIFVLRYALDIDRQRGRRDDEALPVYTLPEPEEEFRRLPFKTVYDVRTYSPGDAVTIGDLTVSFAATRHFIPACAVGVEAGGRRLVFSADTGYSENVIEFACGADLFLCEANLDRIENEGHLNGFQAGRMARLAGVRRLMLTHLFPGMSREEQQREAESGFGGPVEVAVEGATYEV